MPPGDRAAALASRSPKQRAVIEERLKEFDAMNPAERELRLRLLQVRHYLLPLLQTEPAGRSNLLAQVPASNRRLVEARLKMWDGLSREQQNALLANDEQLQRFQCFGTNTPPPLPPVSVPPAMGQQQHLESSLARWRSSTPPQRERVFAQFQRMSALGAQERARLLKELPEPERGRVERSLEAFEKLPPANRAMWIQAFEQFSNMNPDERRSFLGNAARWEAMAPAERRAWREIVAELPPLPTALPPLPSASVTPRRQPLATNDRPGTPP
jgi:hypothetical protein